MQAKHETDRKGGVLHDEDRIILLPELADPDRELRFQEDACLHSGGGSADQLVVTSVGSAGIGILYEMEEQGMTRPDKREKYGRQHCNHRCRRNMDYGGAYQIKDVSTFCVGSETIILKVLVLTKERIMEGWLTFLSLKSRFGWLGGFTGRFACEDPVENLRETIPKEGYDCTSGVCKIDIRAKAIQSAPSGKKLGCKEKTY